VKQGAKQGESIHPRKTNKNIFLVIIPSKPCDIPVKKIEINGCLLDGWR
jgi:hypothetical protein